jgi:hypothetical protein
MIADYLETARRGFARHRFFRAALRASLRRREIPLVIDHLFFFTVGKNLFALNTRKFKVWHGVYLLARESVA